MLDLLKLDHIVIFTKINLFSYNHLIKKQNIIEQIVLCMTYIEPWTATCTNLNGIKVTPFCPTQKVGQRFYRRKYPCYNDPRYFFLNRLEKIMPLLPYTNIPRTIFVTCTLCSKSCTTSVMVCLYRMQSKLYFFMKGIYQISTKP